MRAARRETDLAARGGRGVAGPGGGLLGLPERLTEQLESTAHGWMRGKVLATHSRGGVFEAVSVRRASPPPIGSSPRTRSSLTSTQSILTVLHLRECDICFSRTRVWQNSERQRRRCPTIRTGNVPPACSGLRLSVKVID